MSALILLLIPVFTVLPCADGTIEKNEALAREILNIDDFLHAVLVRNVCVFTAILLHFLCMQCKFCCSNRDGELAQKCPSAKNSGSI